jgi:hypothetical protein
MTSFPQPERSCRREFLRINGRFLSGKRFERSLNYFVGIVALCFLFARIGSAATYYVDYSTGQDLNNGTAKTTPWKHHPYMNGWTGSYSHSAGDHFIFKGGVTWPSSSLPVNVAFSGTQASPDFYGTDTTWFAGGSFTRPIFDGGYAVSRVFNLLSYVTVDNIDMGHVLRNTTRNGDCVIGDGTPDGSLIYSTINNCHVHGWRPQSGATTDSNGGGFWSNNYHTNCNTNTISNTEIENSENPNSWNGDCIRFGGRIIGCHVHHNSSGMLFVVSVENTELNNISYPNGGLNDTQYHTNGIYLDSTTLNQTTGYIRNCLIHDVSSGANMAYLNGRFATQYCYNNVFYGICSDQRPIEIEPYDYGANATSGNYYIWNNTIDCTAHPGLAVNITDRGGAPRPAVVVVQNCQMIDTTGVGGGPTQTLTQDHNLSQTGAQASSAGYTLANLYLPILANSPTVDQGTNSSASVFTTDRLGISRPQGAAWDIGAYEFLATPPAPQNLRISAQ